MFIQFEVAVLTERWQSVLLKVVQAPYAEREIIPRRPTEGYKHTEVLR